MCMEHLPIHLTSRVDQNFRARSAFQNHFEICSQDKVPDWWGWISGTFQLLIRFPFMSFPVHGSNFPSLGWLLVPPGMEEARLHKHGRSKSCKTRKLILIEQWLHMPQVGRASSAAGVLDQCAPTLSSLRVAYSTQDHKVNHCREGTVFGTREVAHISEQADSSWKLYNATIIPGYLSLG